MTMPITAPIRVEGVHKSYHGQAVLKNVSLQLRAGEIFGLIGLNGAGKTTLIKSILDLITADSGTISIFDQAAASVEARKQYSYLPEKFQPSRYLRGSEYLTLSLSYYEKQLDLAHAREKAVALDLNPDVLGQRVGSYSKGMGQKLGLLSNFLIHAPLSILDEPMSGLDPRARVRLKEMLLEYKRGGNTVFFSSHILSDIDEICDRIGVIHEGVLIFTGTPALFKQQYGHAVLEQAFLHAIARPPMESAP